jgi:6-pyruvoyltetrahydropterin/6-carboxytetrahydropterin synthase
VLRSPRLSDADNERVYGKCANPAGHGHDYGLEVTVSGPVDPETGSIVAPGRLDELVAERVLARLAHRLLNDDPWFRSDVPTAENIVRAVRRELAPPLAAAGARLVRVRLHETRRNTFECEEDA